VLRIFIAESNPDLRVGLQFLINQRPGLQVTGIAVNGNDLISQVNASIADVMLLDWELPGRPIDELIVDLKALHQPLKIIVISTQPNDEVKANAAGVDGFTTKSDSPSKLIDVLFTMIQNKRK